MQSNTSSLKRKDLFNYLNFGRILDLQKTFRPFAMRIFKISNASLTSNTPLLPYLSCKWECKNLVHDDSKMQHDNEKCQEESELKEAVS